MRQIDLISLSTGKHILEFGMNSDETSNFKMQMWITKGGKRAVDFVQGLSLGFISFMGGDVWIHNSNSVPRCNFFGEQKYSVVGVVANQEPNIIKILDSIGIHTDGEWEITSITIPKTLNAPNGMYSRLPKERFKKREGVYQAEFLRNLTTKDGTPRVNQIMSGESLRGNAAYLILKNTNTDQVRLYKIDINLSKSR